MYNAFEMIFIEVKKKKGWHFFNINKRRKRDKSFGNYKKKKKIVIFSFDKWL